jgi:hypothetical protein
LSPTLAATKNCGQEAAGVLKVDVVIAVLVALGYVHLLYRPATVSGEVSELSQWEPTESTARVRRNLVEGSDRSDALALLIRALKDQRPDLVANLFGRFYGDVVAAAREGGWKTLTILLWPILQVAINLAE